MFELPKKLEEKYEYIRACTPELEDYKEYLENTSNSEPASTKQFIDVATYIAARLVPKKLDLSQEERTLLLKYHTMQRINHLLDVVKEYPPE